MEDGAQEADPTNIDGLQDVMKRLSLAVNVAETVMPKELAGYVPNALLNVTISRMIGIEGRENTATLLSTLSKLLMDGIDPATQGPVRLPGRRSVTD